MITFSDNLGRLIPINSVVVRVPTALQFAMTKNFFRQNLQGRSFKGENLRGANFSCADIRGADFSNAILADANFTKAQAGVTDRWGISLLLISLFLSVISGYFSGLASSLLSISFSPNTSNLVVALMLGVFVFIAIRKGVWATIFVEGTAVSLAMIAAATAQLILSLAARFASSELTKSVDNIADFAAAIFKAVSIVGTAAWAVAIAVLAAAALVLAGIIAGILATLLFTVIALIVGSASGGMTAAGLVIFVALLGTGIAWRSLTGCPIFAPIYNLAIEFTTLGGTNFCGADLTAADFTSARLQSTNFDRAILMETCWHHAIKIECARLGGSILSNAKIRHLLQTKKGRKGNFIGLNLVGANLAKADLVQANFSHANLYRANFAGANLKGANFAGANLIEADFNGANLDEVNLGGANLRGAAMPDLEIKRVQT